MGLTTKVVTGGGWKGCQWPGGRAGPHRNVVIGARQPRAAALDVYRSPFLHSKDVTIARQRLAHVRHQIPGADQSDEPRNQSVGRLNCGWNAAGPHKRRITLKRQWHKPARCPKTNNGAAAALLASRAIATTTPIAWRRSRGLGT